MLYARGSSFFLRCIPRCPAIQPRWSHVFMAEKEESSSAPRRASTTSKKKATPSGTTGEQGTQPPSPDASAQQSKQFPLDPDTTVQPSEQFPLDPEPQPIATRGRRKITTVAAHSDNGTGIGNGKGTGPQLLFRNRSQGKENVKVLHVGPRVKPAEYVAAILPRAELQQECENLKELEKHLRAAIRLAEKVPIYPMRWDTGPESDLPKVVFTEETYEKGLAEARCILLREVREGRPHDPDVPGPEEAASKQNPQPDATPQRRTGTGKKAPTRRRKADTADS